MALVGTPNELAIADALENRGIEFDYRSIMLGRREDGLMASFIVGDVILRPDPVDAFQDMLAESRGFSVRDVTLDTLDEALR